MFDFHCSPDTIVVAVVAKEAWKKNLEYTHPMSVSLAVTKKYPQPQKGLLHPGSSPKLSPNPNIQYVRPPNITSTAFLIMMLTSFLVATDPLSRRPNPAAKMAV